MTGSVLQTSRATTRALRRARKIMLYSHDTYGLGHLRRNLRIAGHFLSVAPDLQIMLASGSPVADHFPTPARLTVVKLPSVRKIGAEQYRPLDSRVEIGLIRRARTAIMTDVVRRFRPDVLLVDHSPAGMNGELLDVFAAAREHSPATKVVLGLRDILDDPATVVRTWDEQGIYPLLSDVYDQIVVYGSRDVFDVGRHYRLPSSVIDRLFYTGYIAPAPIAANSATDHSQAPRPYLLATAGGGGDGVDVLAAAMDAGAALGARTKVIAGPLIDDEAYLRLQARAEQAGDVELVKFHPSLQQAMAGASSIITMGGYNSLCEAISAQVPTIVVPRSKPRLEQTIRAGIFADRGLVSMVEAGPDLASRLARAVPDRAATKPTANAGASRPIDLDGLDKLASFLLRVSPATDNGAHRDHRRLGQDLLAERLPA